jgi:hypothetical protein
MSKTEDEKLGGDLISGHLYKNCTAINKATQSTKSHLGKQKISQMFKILPLFCGIRAFMAVFTTHFMP